MSDCEGFNVLTIRLTKKRTTVKVKAYQTHMHKRTIKIRDKKIYFGSIYKKTSDGKSRN